MVASSPIVTVTSERAGVRGGTGMDTVILIHGGVSSSMNRNRSDSTTATHIHLPKGASSVTTRSGRGINLRKIQAELERPSSPSDDNNSHLRRVRSDNLAQSKREDLARRSIFGHYFKEQPRSISEPHLVRRPTPPPPLPLPVALQTQQEEKQQSPKRLYRRSSSDPASPDKVGKFEHGVNDDRQHNRINHHQEHHHVDYRLFAPSDKQAAASAICSRYRKLNQDHEQEYNSVLARQVQVEHSLPPFPSPLIRFCSETTTKVAENELHSWPSNEHGLTSSEREMHYHGVYTLLTPISILRPPKYNAGVTTDTIANIVPHPILNSKIQTKAVSKGKDGEDHHHQISSSFTESLNFPRSYCKDSSSIQVLKNFLSSPTDDVSVCSMDGEEEKKESDHTLPPHVLNPSPFLAADVLKAKKADVEGPGSSGIAIALNALNANDPTLDKDPEDKVVASGIGGALNIICSNEPTSNKDLRDELDSTQSQEHTPVRFDPRVTVTEFEDPVPRMWYQEEELNQHKQQAIALAQSYLREHPAVADWYRRATLDPVTNTYRKRALYSLPVFSSTYSRTDTEPHMDSTDSGAELHHTRSLMKASPGGGSSCIRKKGASPVQKIMIVDPNPAIALLFRKSMQSMFPSAEIVTGQSYEEASQLVEESYALTDEAIPFDIIVVEQKLTTSRLKTDDDETKKKSSNECRLTGLLDMFRGLRSEPKQNAVVPLSNCNFRDGADLIRQIRQLSSGSDALPPCLLIGVSIRPERDAILMRSAGADVVWGIPIPAVGNMLRNKLLTTLHAKRSNASSSPPDATPTQS